jgi:hypothetical protein
MRDWLRKRLDAYENRQVRRDEKFAEIVGRNVDALSDRRTLNFYVAALSGLNLAIWLSVIIFPQYVSDAWATVTDLNDRIGLVILAFIFGIGLWLTYSLFRLKFPDLEGPNFDEELLASYSYSLHSSKRWRIWLFSVVGGVMNVLLLVATTIFLAKDV